ncbi:hypothetical protein [Streptomyces cacaoi]|uniref:Uncharacterized protein n=1 Tax=Streptomyces cacaoi TaxID=1898 RepID=A0A4Y3QSK0_STRCI|nr:hypothetical protein [Streptomyces cacaoi]NNG84042.1 hypothetical protein [Streptomyces cacaoi]GEB48386.1 hypothetical protein SCA03_09370 [Streptomyces cacaoi]
MLDREAQVARRRGEVTMSQRRNAPIGACCSLVVFVSMGTVGIGLGWDRNAVLVGIL